MYCVFSIQYYLFQYLFEHLCYVHVHVNRHVYVCMYSYTAKLVYVIGSEKRDHFARAGDFLFST